MQAVRSGQRSTRTKTTRPNPAPVTVTFRCPRCGRDHRADEHGVAHLSEFRRLDSAALRQLRAEVLEEIAAGVQGGAEHDHLKRVAALLGAVDARLERLDV